MGHDLPDELLRDRAPGTAADPSRRSPICRSKLRGEPAARREPCPGHLCVRGNDRDPAVGRGQRDRACGAALSRSTRGRRCAVWQAASNHSARCKIAAQQQQRLVGQLGDFQHGTATERVLARQQPRARAWDTAGWPESAHRPGPQRQVNVAAFEARRRAERRRPPRDGPPRRGGARRVLGQEIREQVLDHCGVAPIRSIPCLPGLERAGALAERFGFRQQATAAPQRGLHPPM